LDGDDKCKLRGGDKKAATDSATTSQFEMNSRGKEKKRKEFQVRLRLSSDIKRSVRPEANVGKKSNAGLQGEKIRRKPQGFFRKRKEGTETKVAKDRAPPRSEANGGVR